MWKKLSSWKWGNSFRRLMGVRLGCFHQYSARELSVSHVKAPDGFFDLPSIAIVTPSFNQVRFVRETIRCVLGQGYKKLEYVVQDGYSTDGTASILREYAGDELRIFIDPDRGQADAINRGFSVTSAEIMGYLNSDDLLMPGTLNFIGGYFRDNPEVDVIYGNRIIIDEYGMEVGRWILPGHDEKLLREIDYVPQETMFWRRRIWENVGARMDDRLHFAMDWELILRFAKFGAVFHHVPDLFGIFRVHDSQKSQVDSLTYGAAEVASLRCRYGDRAVGQIGQIVRHLYFLHKHRIADAIFERQLSNEDKQ